MNAKQITTRANEFLNAKSSKIKLIQMMNKEENQDLLVLLMTELRDNKELAEKISEKMFALHENS